MANRRDLKINIDGDAKGFDAAVTEAEAAAKGLDRELAKLERQQAAQEKVTARTAAAVKQYGAEQNKAALSARRLGSEAEKAAKQAEQAQIRAAAAADAYSRGLIDEERSLRAATRAEDATERAAIKAAEAHRAAARAAEEQAQQERQLARDAELAAAAEQLGVLKASGSVREHNALLRDLESRFGDLSKEGQGAFTAIESRSEKALQSIGSTAPGQIALVIGALAAVPFAAAAAQTAVAGGLGGALIGVGLAATKSDAQVQAALSGMAAHVKETTVEISGPFKQTWLDIASTATKTFDELAPHLKQDFAELAPAASQLVKVVGTGIAGLGPALDSASRAAAKLLASLSADAPEVFGNIGRAVQTLADGIAAHPEAIPNLITNVSQLLPLVANLINYAQQVGPVFNLMYGVLTSGTSVISHLGDVLGVVSLGLIGVGHGSDTATKALPPLASNAKTATTASQQLAKDMQTLGSSTATTADRTNALNDALTSLFDPELAAYEDTARLRQGFDDLSAALAKSHGRIGDNSAAAAAAKLAFAGLLQQTEQYAKDLTNSGDKLDVVQGKLAPYILALYRAAGSNKEARAQVDAFTRAVGLVPPKKGTTLYNNAAQQKAAVAAYQRQINALKGKTVNIYQVMHLTTTQAYLNKRKAILGYAGGGIVHRAAGGPIQHLADGGPSGMVSGPGTGTSDSILTALSNGEFVINARATAANRPLLEAVNSGARIPVGATAADSSSSAAGGAAPPIDYDRLAGALTQAMRREGVGAAYIDGQSVTDNVSRRIGQQTSLRRRTG